jgi:hypothetical protein
LGHVLGVGLRSRRIADVEIVEADAVALAGKAVRGCEPFPGLVDRENCPLRVEHGDIGRQHVDDAGVEHGPDDVGAMLMDRHESPSLARTIHESCSVVDPLARRASVSNDSRRHPE